MSARSWRSWGHGTVRRRSSPPTSPDSSLRGEPGCGSIPASLAGRRGPGQRVRSGRHAHELGGHTVGRLTGGDPSLLRR
ncbi:hypothetical protein GTW37_29025, partial [Streptomyces sp. SID4931]|nr:hypothetical protein [Streptomyces sp. SID4931]